MDSHASRCPSKSPPERFATTTIPIPLNIPPSRIKLYKYRYHFIAAIQDFAVAWLFKRQTCYKGARYWREDRGSDRMSGFYFSFKPERHVVQVLSSLYLSLSPQGL